MFTIKKTLLFMLLVTSILLSPLQAKDHNLTDAQLHAVMGIITNFILTSVDSDIGSDGSGISITYNDTTYITVTSPYTGRVWLDRNLGASRVCTSFDDTACYGDYYQWGRNYDGHQSSTSSTTNTKAANVNSAGSSYIISISDWALVDNEGIMRTANWSTIDGSSVCPVGFRVPDRAELEAELLDVGSAEIQNREDAFNSFLALPSGGNRETSGSLSDVGSLGRVWASSVYTFYGNFVVFGSGYAYSNSNDRAYGYTVRCLKDY